MRAHQIARRVVVSLLLLLGSLLLSLPLMGQTSTGQITITVLDPSGAVIPGATVTITGTETGNVARELKTNDHGVAKIPLLRPLDYTVSVSAPGFRELIQKGIVLAVGDDLALPLTLQPGSTTQQVTVVGQSPVLEQNTGTLADILPQTAIADIPINGRNYLIMGNDLPGAVPSGGKDDTFFMYGNSGMQNAFVLDGARDESYMRGQDLGGSGGDPVLGARDAYRPPMDAISEFSVNSSNFSAQYGASAGAVVMVVTKSGTNQIHGSVYEYYQSNWLNARNFFYTPSSATVSVANQFGGSLGGPIKKNKAWFFGNYEGTGRGGGTPGVATVPTAAMDEGNFSGLSPIYDPSTTVANPSGSGYVRTEYTNNMIPSSEFNSVGQSILAMYPQPDSSGNANNYRSEVTQDLYNSNALFRGDYQMTDKSSMFGRFAFTQYNLLAAAVLPTPAGDPVRRLVPTRALGYGYTHTFSTSMVNEVRFSWDGLTLNESCLTPLNPIVGGMLDPKINCGTANVSITGYTAIDTQPSCCSNTPLNKTSGVWDLSDNLTRTWGKHLFKVGADFLYLRMYTIAPNSARGTLTYSGVFTQNPQSRSGTGNAAADLLLGDTAQVQNGNYTGVTQRGHYYGLYFQDDWRFSSHLTVNLGMRYEIWPPYIEVHNAMANLITYGPNFGQYVFSGNSSYPRALMTTDFHNFAPRVGFAYHVPKVNDLVVRAAFGIFFAQENGLGIGDLMTNNPPYYNYGGVNIISNQILPSTGLVLSPGVSVPFTVVSPSQFVYNPASTTGLNVWPQRFTTSYVQQWNLTVEKVLPGHLLWQVNYVGNTGVDLWNQWTGNDPVAPAAAGIATRRPYIQYSDAAWTITSPWNRDHYDGLSTELRRQMTNGLYVLGNFTWGNSLSLGQADGGLCSNYCGSSVQNEYNLESLMGHAGLDVPVRFVLSGVYNLPFGRTHRLANQGVAAALAGGWNIDGVFTVSSGAPFTPTMATDTANDSGTTFPNRICNGQLSNPTLQEWFNTSCFVGPANYTYGNAGRDVVFGPRLANDMDFAIHRTFKLPIHESANLQIRAESFNFLNHPQFTDPGSTIGTTSVGIVSSTNIPNRVIQVAGRITW